MIDWLKRIAALAAVAIVTACGGGDDRNPNIVELAKASPNLTVLVEAVTAADLAATLSGPGPYTVFAPTDAAFTALLAELGVTKAQLLADKALLTKVLTYHVVSGSVRKAQVPLNTLIATIQGGSIRVSAGDSDLFIIDERGRSSKIASTDAIATNGVVHVIDKVLLPKGNIVEMAKANPNLSILVEAVVAADLAGTLSGTGPFTVFAPTDAAFAALLTELGVTKEALLADKPLLTAVLKYHVLSPQVVKKADIPLGKAIQPLLPNAFFKIDAVGSAAIITDGRNRSSTIVATDVLATNGVIHVIDKVILPADKNIVQTAVGAAPEFSILVEAVTAADLAGILSQPGPFTVFAPTNAAFEALLTELGITKAALLADKPLLTRVLTYHVIAGKVLKADISIGAAVPTLQGDTFTIDGSLDINDQRGRKARIVTTDVLTGNGVIHVIDKVILPSEPAV